MGFQNPMYRLDEYLKDTTTGVIQLPDFQRQYKWDEERVRQLLVTVLRGHPMGVVMLLETGNDQVRFKPRPVEGTDVKDKEPGYLLLDGQQRLTSLTQALTGDGIVHTKDARGKLLDRRFFINIADALADPDRVEEAVIAVPADGIIKKNFDRDVVLDLSTTEKQYENGYFPLNLLYSSEGTRWLMKHPNNDVALEFLDTYVQRATQYQIPAIELDKETDKAAVATVFEKVNIGGLPLNVFELLTAVFAGDGSYYAETGEDFRLNDDWLETKKLWEDYLVLRKVENTDFLQAVTMLASLKKQQVAPPEQRKVAVTAKREDVLRLTLADYLEWRDPLRDAFLWTARFLADLHVFTARDIPYQKQLVPLAAIKVVLGKDADLHSVRAQLVRWYWSGVFGELYGSAIETRFARDLEMVPAWCKDETSPAPRTVTDANFVESRLHSMRTRNSAAYKGVMALLMANNSKDWMEDKMFGAVQYKDMNVDIHHIFPQAWCNKNNIDDEHRESIVNKTMLSARTNRVIGGVAPSSYVSKIERTAKISEAELDELLRPHLVDPQALRSDDFESFFATRREALCHLVESAIGKPVQRDISAGQGEEDSSHFDQEEM
ncbi:GmrSD restriction endonuclease domain-containing protein [Corynebacterium coyleae]